MADTTEVLQNDLLLRAARGEKVERPPIWVMRQAGRYLPEYHVAKGGRDFFECCRDAEVASTLTLQPIERFAGLIDAAIIFSDILVVPQALGMTVEMIDKKGPHFPAPLADPDDPQVAPLLAKPVAAAADELEYVYAAVRRTREKLHGRVPLIGFCGAPWTLFCYMVEGGGTRLFAHSKRWIYAHPDTSGQLLHKLAEVCVEHLARQVQAGAQLVQVFDSWAGELSPAAFRRFAQPALAHIADALPRRLQQLGLAPVPMIVFPKGAWYALDACCQLGYDVVGLDWQHDPAEAVRTRADRPVVLQGNADPGVLYGTHDAIVEAVRDMVVGFDWANRHQGWIVNLGHGITPFVKPDDLKFFLEEVHRQTKT
ncbi:uroporphyrinogen decarboxylase [Grosmannia clavigera kw1407]|uniref:Uroporphyrinogen decarboxylase n=1 Tax=Grosmannia clavigera (strain kw1407 / UAMH 11150) TaxID=655863 RepID=F0XKR0_GROCL|nr:uroporphyrinogen decarboxylase [Grosmannia clavigera kw1407]EFX01575.1 uroporphyrinogen decarboxylase [Grosmannia clavigera kw1407]